MTVALTIRPNVLPSPLVGVTSGGLSSVNDASDTTLIQFNATTGGSATFGFADPTIPAGALIASVQLFYRVATSFGSALIASRLFDQYPTGGYKVLGTGFSAGTTISTFASPVLTTNPEGHPWAVTDLPNLVAQILANPNARLYDVWIVVSYYTVPTVSVTAPAGAITVTVRPEVDWTYTNADPDLEGAYQVKIFSAAQYGAGGFNPDSSAAVWDSGVVLSNAGGVALPVNLPNSTSYRAYVRVRSADPADVWSAWGFSAFNIAVPVPATPTLAVLGTAACNVTLTVTGLTLGNGVVVERSDDGGTTWAPVRGSYLWLATGGSFVGTDYEPPVNIQTRYRAWQWNTDSGHHVFASNYSAVATVLLTNSVIRLKDPANPGYQITVALTDAMQITSSRLEGIFAPVGSKTAVVLVDSTPGGDQIAATLYFKTEGDYRSFLALRATGHVLQLCGDIPGDQWYVQITGDLQVTLIPKNRLTKPYRTLPVTFIEVDAPPDTSPLPGS